MCGLFGWLLPPEKYAEWEVDRLGMALSFYNLDRGKDSWGAFFHDQRMQLVVDKASGPIVGALDRLYFPHEGLFMGHTRASTVGSSTAENAHPFIFRRNDGKSQVVGAHNGSVGNYKELNTKYKRNLAVDSMQIFAHMADNLDLEEVQAAGAITWVEQDLETDQWQLKLSKFNGGSLDVARLDDGGFVWSSNWIHLTDALKGIGMKHTVLKIKEGAVYFGGADKVLYTSKDKLRISPRPTISVSNYGHMRNGSWRSHDGFTSASDVEKSWKTAKVRLRFLIDDFDTEEVEKALVDDLREIADWAKGKSKAMVSMRITGDERFGVIQAGNDPPPVGCTLGCNNSSTWRRVNNQPACLDCVLELLVRGTFMSFWIRTKAALAKIEREAAALAGEKKEEDPMIVNARAIAEAVVDSGVYD